MDGDADLAQVGKASRSQRLFLCRRKRRQEERSQNRQDGNHDQQFHQREAFLPELKLAIVIHKLKRGYNARAR